MALLSLLFVAIANLGISAQQTVLYSNAGPLDPNSEDLLTHIQMQDHMFLQMDINIDSFPSDGSPWKYLFFIGDPYARVPDIWLWDPVKYPQYQGFAVHFSRDGSGRLTFSLSGSDYTMQENTVYTLEVCYDQTDLTTRMSGGNIDGIYTVQATKAIHDDVEEEVYVGYPNNDIGDADVTITNLVIGANADCSVPLDLGVTPTPTVSPTTTTPAGTCCVNTARIRRWNKEKRIDIICSGKSTEEECDSGPAACEWLDCSLSVMDEDGERVLRSVYDEKVLMHAYDADAYTIGHGNVWWYGIVLFVVIMCGVLYKKRYICSEYKELDGVDSITPLLSADTV